MRHLLGRGCAGMAWAAESSPAKDAEAVAAFAEREWTSACRQACVSVPGRGGARRAPTGRPGGAWLSEGPHFRGTSTRSLRVWHASRPPPRPRRRAHRARQNLLLPRCRPWLHTGGAVVRSWKPRLRRHPHREATSRDQTPKKEFGGASWRSEPVVLGTFIVLHRSLS